MPGMILHTPCEARDSGRIHLPTKLHKPSWSRFRKVELVRFCWKGENHKCFFHKNTKQKGIHFERYPKWWLSFSVFQLLNCGMIYIILMSWFAHQFFVSLGPIGVFCTMNRFPITSHCPYHPWDWYIYLHLVDVYGTCKNVGKHTSPMDGMGWIIPDFLWTFPVSEVLKPYFFFAGVHFFSADGDPGNAETCSSWV